MNKTIFIIILILIGFNGLSQNDSITFKAKSNIDDTVAKHNSDMSDYSSTEDMLQGKLEDPYCYNELGLKVIVGTEIPNFGIGIDYNPIFLKKFIEQIEYRNDFRKNLIFAASIESQFLLNKRFQHLDFKIEYERIQIQNSILSDYYKLSFGPIYRQSWNSFGFLLGQDFYERQIGFDIFFKYRFNSLTSNSKNKYKSKLVVQTKFGYWDNEITHDYYLTYNLNPYNSFGIGHRKLYDFKEGYLTYRYLWH